MEPAMPANPFAWSFRAQFVFGTLACSSLLAFAIFSQRSLLLEPCPLCILQRVAFMALALVFAIGAVHAPRRSEEHTSELQSLMRISYAVFCLKKKNKIL